MILKLTIESRVKNGSEIIGQTTEDVNKKYNIDILSTTRYSDSYVERTEHTNDDIIQKNDIIEICGVSKNVTSFLRLL